MFEVFFEPGLIDLHGRALEILGVVALILLHVGSVESVVRIEIRVVLVETSVVLVETGVVLLRTGVVLVETSVVLVETGVVLVKTVVVLVVWIKPIIISTEIKFLLS